MTAKEMKEQILGTIDDLCMDFLYYDRKEDEDLTVEAIQHAVKSGVVTVDDMVNDFQDGLNDRLSL